ncbi:MAG: hypothetical protein COB30_020885 [Ectothiorhodospiraceae bacterium]|nr:hypothetical protein [Ectothiorhodospiraceae bacterium]
MDATIHTLGPLGTNCEMAAKLWANNNYINAELKLYDTLENAQKMVKDKGDYLLACIVYPDLHNLVFKNLKDMKLIDCFVMNTYEMVLASANGVQDIKRVVSHPAPISLIESKFENIYTTSSNSNAAILTKQGKYDACITTIEAANKHDLSVVKSFGEIEMGFSVHGKR